MVDVSTEETYKVKRRCAYIFLLIIAFSIPFHVAYLYFDYYSDLNFHYRKYYSTADEENLLTYLKNNPRALYQPPVSIHDLFVPLLQPTTFHFDFIPVWDEKDPVLRC